RPERSPGWHSLGSPGTMRRMPADAPQRMRTDAPPSILADLLPAPTAARAAAAAPEPPPAWHALTSADVLERLGGPRTAALPAAGAAARLARHGPNRVAEPERTSPWRLLFEQFKNVLVLILLVGAAISVALGHEVEAIAIVVIVLFAVSLGFVQ